MKEIVSLLITTSCLALAGLGIYFFSSKSNDIDDNQKEGKDNIVKYKRNEFKKNRNKNSDIDINNDNDNDSDSDSNELNNEPIKKRNNTKNNKTSKNKNKFTTSRKKYY
jgi:hypothetical protein